MENYKIAGKKKFIIPIIILCIVINLAIIGSFYYRGLVLSDVFRLGDNPTLTALQLKPIVLGGFIILICLSIIFIIDLIGNIHFVQKYNYAPYFGLLLSLFPIICWPILGFGTHTYTVIKDNRL